MLAGALFIIVGAIHAGFLALLWPRVHVRSEPGDKARIKNASISRIVIGSSDAQIRRSPSGFINDTLLRPSAAGFIIGSNNGPNGLGGGQRRGASGGACSSANLDWRGGSSSSGDCGGGRGGT